MAAASSREEEEESWRRKEERKFKAHQSQGAHNFPSSVQWIRPVRLNGYVIGQFAKRNRKQEVVIREN
ncbi:hypothetical protein L2E82_14924 [Cichorium intybus]|uniref:Uncharacterized protein n=1 Tax=Cichorium intybus TaxID=13427 RepID=A0ACB9F2L8_CICIN|nr:hypothetical protein L2E82_14924 [Cichorium intybus]